MRWAQIKDQKGTRAVCLHEQTVYEFPAKLGPLLQFYGRYRLNFGDPKNALAIMREMGDYARARDAAVGIAEFCATD